MSGHGFTSAFAYDLDRYLAFKESMGFHGQSRIWYLRDFDKYCSDRGLECFDRHTVEGWVIAKRSHQTIPHWSWISYIRDFGRWVRINGNENAYVLSEQWKAGFIHTQPYLLTREEVTLFFQAAARLEVASPWKWQAVAFFALMHSCGLRTCEARQLTINDVDLAGGFIDVQWSKTNRSRRLPITGQISGILDDCDQASRNAFGKERAAFFVSGAGTPVTPAAVGVAFNRIWDLAGLSRAAQGKRPRPYDFRHHFAYTNIERWMAEGIDVNSMLPYLARYMGHASLDSPYYYIHTSPDFMNAYAGIAREGQCLLPEVGFE
ncbi:tyrosine-type recombinase/integrase [Arthrobacter sp. CG_A4]|uniref:tyrosine-type recombinase/integrase n=1 Tax=Arthrobacter sp. CG_A4 TaxID=3071706 RepID=UPI002DFE26A3|nr:integrase [Arthrobacter sp. CG_A4]